MALLMKQVGLASVIIPVFNRPGLLHDAVASVLAQTYRPIEIIIADDGSTDETPEVIKALARAYPETVRYVLNRKGGPGPAREAGRQMARGEFIQYLDSDDLLLPNKFTIQVKALRDNPGAGVAYGITRLIDQDGKVLVSPYKWTEKNMAYLFPALLIDRWWCTHTPLYRRSVTDAVGSWTDLRYSQDWEYDAKVGALRTRLVWCNELVSSHRAHSANRQTGHGRWLHPTDRVRFFTLLYDHAIAAGVSQDTLEMRHFSRWVFLNARQCGALGDSEAAKQLFELSAKAAGGESLDLKVYRLFSEVVGWAFAGKTAQVADRLFKRRPGAHTVKQSWMK